MKREDINYCECCGDLPATLQRAEDPNAYCDACVSRMTAEDFGVAIAAIQMMTLALGTLHDQVTDPAETRRVVNQVLDDVLAGNDYRDPDVLAFTMAPKFQPLDEAVAA